MNCLMTTELAVILEHGDEEAARRIVAHAQNCPACQAEIERLRTKQAGPQENTAATVLKWLAVAFQFFVMRGITDVVSQTIRKAGGSPPFWKK